MGTPYVRLRNTGFYEALIPQYRYAYASYGDTVNKHIELFDHATICSPVLTQNPVTYRKFKAAFVSKEGNNATADGCSDSSPIYSVDLTVEPATSFGVCMDGQALGEATIVMTSVHNQASKLATVMRDDDNLTTISGIPTYSSICKIDIAQSVNFRSIQYTRISSTSGLSGLGYPFEVNGTNATCAPNSFGGDLSTSDLLTDANLAHNAAALYYMLSQNVYRDGWWDNLYNIAFSCEPFQNRSLDQ